MNRVFKFRAWDGIEEMHQLEREAPEDFAAVLKGEWNNITVMQFVGLNDSAGQDIFEGDVLSGVRRPEDVRAEIPDQPANVVVVWYPGNLEYILVDVEEYVRGTRDEPTYISLDQPWVERTVLGNVHENPELLETRS